ncbi:MAG: hypothetical protein COB81_05095 [Flavobacteriaceae bacterium]|nr:MAG: hypothetical protein COB81_05095 [Flavobacteriaceae bacterium]
MVEFHRKDIKALNAVVFERTKRENIRIENKLDGVKLKRDSSLVLLQKDMRNYPKLTLHRLVLWLILLRYRNKEAGLDET